MKGLCFLVIALLLFQVSLAQEEVRPQFPGGNAAFELYLSKNLRFPPLARLIGINGKLTMLFTVNKRGKVTNAIPKNCIGAGCEAEAIKLLERSPTWMPGTLYGQLSDFQFSVPISYINDKSKVSMNELRKSDHGFVFSIKGKLYTIDEAEKAIGQSFISANVQVAEPFYNYNKIQKFNIQNKKEVYLLIFKKP